MSRSLLNLGCHLYQPPTQNPKIRDEIFRVCYEPLVAHMERYSSIKLSMNLAFSLGEHLPREFLGRLRALYKSGQLEMAPITPRELLVRQIKINEEFYREYIIGDDPLPGIFPPEMAFKQSLAILFRELGYRWCLADDKMYVHQRRRLEEHLRAPATWIPEAFGIGVLLRSRERSVDIAFKDEVWNGRRYARELIIYQKEWREKLGHSGNSYLYMYLDGETFEHHRPGLLERFLRPFCEEIGESNEAELVSLHTIHEQFEKRRTCIPQSSWSTGIGEPPFHLWDHPHNEFHQPWNEFIKTAYAMAPIPIPEELEQLFHKNFYSCSPWQYSMGNKHVARWCLPGFQRIAHYIADRYPDSWEKTRLQELIDTMYSLTT